MRWVAPPPGVPDDFRQVVRVSDLQHPVVLRWVDEYDVEGAPKLSAGVTLHRGLIIGVSKGISFMSRPLVDAGWSPGEAERATRRHVLGHEAAHVRQLERGHTLPLNEYEANDWAYVVFLRLGWDASVSEYLANRWVPGTLWREYDAVARNGS